MTDALDLVDGAAALLARAPTSIAHRRGAAYIARQAVEAAVRHALDEADSPGMSWASRFLVLGALQKDVDAKRGRLIWERWSEVCHYHHYDLVPGPGALSERLAETRRWIAILSGEFEIAASAVPSTEL